MPIYVLYARWETKNEPKNYRPISLTCIYSRLGMSVTTQGGSGRQCVTGPGRNIPKYRFVLLNVYRYWET